MMKYCSVAARIKCLKFIKQYYYETGPTEGRLLQTSLRTTYSPTTTFVSISSKDNHIQRTANIQRESEVIKMKVSKIHNASPTVKYLILNTPERPVPISFKAGQWVDLFIPEVETVGGFSICSSPMHFRRTGDLHLSVKKSDHPPTEWVHKKCKEGSEVSIRIGGNFFLDTDDPESAGKTILLVAGGVGINPIASIVAQLQEYHKNIGIYSTKTLLMFSAKSEAELLFLTSSSVITIIGQIPKMSDGPFNSIDLFNAAALEDPSFSEQYFVTENVNTVLHQQYDSKIKYGRITKSDVLRSLSSYLNQHVEFEDLNKNILVFICGPPPMIQHIEGILKSIGITNILYEKWW